MGQSCNNKWEIKDISKFRWLVANIMLLEFDFIKELSKKIVNGKKRKLSENGEHDGGEQFFRKLSFPN